MHGAMIYSIMQGWNVRYYLEEMVMAGKYCVRERMYVDEDYEECEGCTVCGDEN